MCEQGAENQAAGNTRYARDGSPKRAAAWRGAIDESPAVSREQEGLEAVSWRRTPTGWGFAWRGGLAGSVLVVVGLLVFRGCVAVRQVPQSPDALPAPPIATATAAIRSREPCRLPVPTCHLPLQSGGGPVTTLAETDQASVAACRPETAAHVVSADDLGDPESHDGSDAVISSSMAVRQLNPFADLPATVNVLDCFREGLSSGCELGSFTTSRYADLVVAIDCGAADLNRGRFHVARPEFRAGMARWPIRLMSARGRPAGPWDNMATDGKAGGTVAELVADSGTLSIIRAHGTVPRLTDQLSNCLLVFTLGKSRHALQLREPILMAPLELDLKRSSAALDFRIQPAPRTDCCVLELTFDVATSKTIVALPEQRQLKPNEVLTIKVTRWEGAEIQLRLLESEGMLRLKPIPRYRLNTHKYPLDPAKIVRELALRMNQQLHNRRDLDLAKKRLAKIPAELRKVRKLKPRTPAQRGVRSAALAVLEREAANLQARIHRLAVTVPHLEGSIVRLKQLLPIARELDHHITIRGHLVARTEHGEIQLAVTR